MSVLRFFSIGLVFLSAFALRGQVQSSTWYSSELTWQCMGQGKYQFTAIVYSPCINNLASTAHNLVAPGLSTYYPMQVDFSRSDTLNACGGCDLIRWVITTDTISLTGTPPPGGWTYVYQRCCRFDAQNLNVGSAGASTHLEATFYPYTPPGSTSPLPLDSCYSHSPQFTQKQLMRNCEGPYLYPSNPFDADYDSLHIGFVQPKVTFVNLLSFSSGYSWEKPYPDSTENPLNGPLVVDPQTGLVSMEFYDAGPGNYYGALQAKEYRDGQLIGEVMRELALVVPDSASCAPAAVVNNNKPSLSLLSNTSTPLMSSGNVYRITLMPGDSIDLDITTIDFDFNLNGTPQVVCLSAISNQLNSSNYSLDTGCASASCATILPYVGNGFCGTFAKTYNFKWRPDCTMINTQPQSPRSYIFHLQASDNACPSPKLNQLSLFIDLYPGPATAPALQIDSADTSGYVSLSWTKAAIPTAAPFHRYMIYQRALGSTFIPLDSIYDIDSLEASYFNLPYPSQFFIKAFSGSCNYGSPSSDVLTTSVNINLKEWQSRAPLWTLSPNPVSDYIQLQYVGAAPLASPVQVQIRNLMGARVLFQTLAPKAGSWRIPIKCKAGVYLIEVEAGGRSWTEKLYVH